MQAAKEAVSGFLHHKNHHSVDIEQETKPAVVHERIAEQKHEDVTTAVDREIHQHHHQIHVQPIKDQVVHTEQHHHNVIPIEHREHLHNKGDEIAARLETEQGKFRDEREVLGAQTTQSQQTVVGEHVHHHIHDVIQPVIERETIQPHVVHTTIPVHERIEHEPMVHKGNVLPAVTMAEFTQAGHKLEGYRKQPEHIEYEGEPLAIDGKSHVGFGEGLGSSNRSGEYSTGNTGTGLGSSGTGSTPRTVGQQENMFGSENNTSTGTSGTTGPHKSSLLNKLDPRVWDAKGLACF